MVMDMVPVAVVEPLEEYGTVKLAVPWVFPAVML